ncbi:MAG: transglutaminase domain-containing protein [Methanobacteriota archaeon]
MMPKTIHKTWGEPSFGRLFNIKNQLKQEFAIFSRAVEAGEIGGDISDLSDDEKVWMPSFTQSLKDIPRRPDMLSDEEKTRALYLWMCRPSITAQSGKNQPRTLFAEGSANCIAFSAVGCALARMMGLNSKVILIEGGVAPHACFSTRVGGTGSSLRPLLKRI